MPKAQQKTETTQAPKDAYLLAKQYGISLPDLLERYANRDTKRVAFTPTSKEQDRYYHVRPYIVGAHWRRYPKR